MGDTGIRGIQAGLVDPSSLVFEANDLPEELDQTGFGGDSFFQVFFRTACGYFRQNPPMTGSVTSVQVRWAPAELALEDLDMLGEPLPAEELPWLDGLSPVDDPDALDDPAGDGEPPAPTDLR